MELTVDVVDVGTAHDRHVNSGRAERLDETAYCTRVALTIRNRGPGPVEDDRFEAAVEICRSCWMLRHRVRGSSSNSCEQRSFRGHERQAAGSARMIQPSE